MIGPGALLLVVSHLLQTDFQFYGWSLEKINDSLNLGFEQYCCRATIYWAWVGMLFIKWLVYAFSTKQLLQSLKLFNASHSHKLVLILSTSPSDFLSHNLQFKSCLMAYVSAVRVVYWVCKNWKKQSWIGSPKTESLLKTSDHSVGSNSPASRLQTLGVQLFLSAFKSACNPMITWAGSPSICDGIQHVCMT